jgi:NAD(P)H dehydrogenase (quinone)
VAETFAVIRSDADAGVVKWAFFDGGGELARVIGHPTTLFRAPIAEFLRSPAWGDEAPSRT